MKPQAHRTLTLVYGVGCYLAFLASFLYLIAFLADLGVPKSIDSGPKVDVGKAIAVDLLLIVLFGLQHSVMARPAFKARFTRIVPAPIERSTYVLATVLVLGVFFVAWEPIPVTLFHLTGTAALVAHAVFGLGVMLVLVSTFLIDHFELFGLRQVVEHFRGRALTRPRFRVSPLHRWVRHPLYVGWILTFFATPHLTVGRLLLALGMTVYILVAIRHEEKDLVAEHGPSYERYRREVPMLIPRLRRFDAASDS